jgi:hypothetical protein
LERMNIQQARQVRWRVILIKRNRQPVFIDPI